MGKKQCGTCRYWGDEEDMFFMDSNDGWAGCSGIYQDRGSFVAYTWGDDTSLSGLRTKAEFGCKLWEAEDE